MSYQLGQFDVPGVDIPSPAAAWRWIENKADQFFALEPKLKTMLAQANNLQYKAQQRGDQGAALKAQETKLDLANLLPDYRNVKGKLQTVIDHVPFLGQIGMAIVAGVSVVAVAAAAATIFRKANAAEKALELVEQDVLTPQEATQFAQERRSKGPFGQVADVAKWGALGLGAVFLLPVVRDAVAEA